MDDIWNPGYTEFTYFWGEWPFSQWSNGEFEIDGVNYVTTEQYMMAEKARLFGDTETLEAILETDDPREQKKLGRMVEGFVREEWDAVSRDKVYNGNLAKFTQNEDALKALLATEDTLLVEASPYDVIWGIGLNDFDARRGMPWRGLNWLGEVLTQLRENLLVGNRDAR